MDKPVNHIAFLDIETGGFSFKKHALIEIGLVICEPDGTYRYSWFSLIKRYNENLKYDPKAEAVHGITEAEIEVKGHSAKEVGEQLLKILEHFGVTEIWCHNKGFDWPWIVYFLESFGLYVREFQVNCTLELSKKMIPNLKSYSLQSVREHFEIAQAHSHRALSDAYVTYEVWKKLIR